LIFFVDIWIVREFGDGCGPTEKQLLFLVSDSGVASLLPSAVSRVVYGDHEPKGRKGDATTIVKGEE
jgi:hypothetical protein